MLLEAMPDITDIAIASGDQVKVGIPCCRCYEKIFSTGAAGTARECPPDMRLKLVVVGDDTTDKLRIIQEHARPDFTYNYKLTLGMSLYSKHVTVDGNNEVQLRIWDVASTKRFRLFMPSFLRGASGALVCFDMTRRETFEQIPSWLAEIRKATSNIPVILVATGYEKPDHEVTFEVARQHAAELGCTCVMACSCEDPESIESIYGNITSHMVRYVEN